MTSKNANGTHYATLAKSLSLDQKSKQSPPKAALKRISLKAKIHSITIFLKICKMQTQLNSDPILLNCMHKWIVIVNIYSFFAKSHDILQNTPYPCKKKSMGHLIIRLWPHWKTEAKYLANAVFHHAMQKSWLWLVRTTANQDALHFLRGPSPSLLLMLLGKSTVC